MTVPQTTATNDPQSIIAALRTERDAALSEKAALAEQLAARDAAPAQRGNEFGERIDHQAATLDVLKVMSASPGDPQPVFDLIVRRAQELCHGYGASLFEFDGTLVRSRATHVPNINSRPTQAYFSLFPRKPTRDVLACRAIIDKQIIHIRDIDSEPGLNPAIKAGQKSVLAIPLLREGNVIGSILINSLGTGGFSDAQVALLQTFAEQAVIAISSAETYRTLQTRTADLQESLEYQTATSDVLKVISRSTFDLQPVLTMVAETAMRLCFADQAAIFRLKGDMIHLAVNYGFPPEYKAYWDDRGPVPLGEPMVTALSRTIYERHSVHIHDVAAVPGYPDEAIKLGKQRTSLGVPLLRESEPIGVILLARQRVEAFTDRQMGLVSTFADQAVIAIENTRLLTEQQEALEQQTATAEVLAVINASPGHLAAVFDALLERAMRLCEAAFGSLYTYDGERFHSAAQRGVPPAYAAFRAENPPLPTPGGGPATLLETRRPFQVLDVRAHENHRPDYPSVRAMVELGGIRTILSVPLIKDDETFLGYVSIFRQEVRPFTDKQIALLENFAAQAVIAMENARLLTEQREALEQQTATAEVLQVINTNPGNLMPVFDTVIAKAKRLCGAVFGALYIYDGERFVTVSTLGVPSAFAEYRAQNHPPGRRPSSRGARILKTKQSLHILDVMADELYLYGDASDRAPVDLGGARTLLLVPLLKDATVLGIIAIYRQEVRAFSAKQIALLESFAAQAVIAMENARLLTEQREALEQQTATAEVLQVINASPGNLAPVFDAMLEKALDLCGAAFGVLWTFDGEQIHAVAHRGVGPEFAEYLTRTPHPVGPDNAHGRLLAGESVVHIVDVSGDKAYQSGDPLRRTLVELGVGRTLLAVPLRKDETFLGDFVIYRLEVRPFSDKQIALLENFAAQAVIAMENARLLDQIRRRQEELRITFENMGDGVAMFDETPRLVAWNRKFQDILDVPDDIIARRQTFAEYVRYLADRGEYGAGPGVEEQVRRLTEQVGQYRTYERSRPNGRIIEVRQNPVAGGGFVLIYADITERKHNEAEIRAARDAAEAAFRDLKAAQANLIQAEKMASLGQLTAGIAHEIKNPLNFVNNFAALSVDLLGELKETAAPGFYAATRRARNGGDAGFMPTLKVTTRDADGAVEIRVRDNGTGVQAEITDKLFQPFFTTKPTGEGTGLGLSITYDIVTKQHGGTITVDSEVDAFTEFVVTLPRQMFANSGSRG